MADDTGDPGAIADPFQRTGALYDQYPPAGARPKPLGEVNQSALVIRGRHRDHWLNGVKVLEYESDSPVLEGPLILQHHETDFWFRKIRVRRLE